MFLKELEELQNKKKNVERNSTNEQTNMQRVSNKIPNINAR